MSNELQAKLYAALAKAQAQMQNPTKNREVSVKSERGAYKFAYATLDSILDGIRKPLGDNGLSLTQALEKDEQGLGMVLRLAHADGGMLKTVMPLDQSRFQKMQEMGSAMTFARRYQVAAFFGLAAEEDDDGNSADGNHAEMRDRKPAPKPAAAPAFDARAEFKRVQNLILGATEALAIADIIMAERETISAIKKVSEQGYAALMKAKDDRITELSNQGDNDEQA